MTAPKSSWIWCSNEFIVQTIQCLEFILIIVLKVKNGWNKFKVRNKDIRTSLFSQCWFFVIDDFKHIVIWLVLSSIFYILTTISQLAIKMQNIFFGSSWPELDCKKDLLSNFVSQKIPALGSLLRKVAGQYLQIDFVKNLMMVFSSEFCVLFFRIVIVLHLWKGTSVSWTCF